jgi:hypothetical protein
MRSIQNTSGWLSIDSAPLDEDVTLLVIDGASEPYPLKLPSRLTAAGWVSSSRGTPLAVTPVKWKPYNPPRPFRKKGWRAKLDGGGRPGSGRRPVEPARFVEQVGGLIRPARRNVPLPS